MALLEYCNWVYNKHDTGWVTVQHDWILASNKAQCTCVYVQVHNTTVEPPKKDNPNKGHKNLHIKDPFRYTNNELAYSGNYMWFFTSEERTTSLQWAK